MYPLCEHTLKLTQVCCFAGLPKWGAWKPPRSRGNMTQASCFYIEYLAIEEWFCSLGWLGSMIEMSPTKGTGDWEEPQRKPDQVQTGNWSGPKPTSLGNRVWQVGSQLDGLGVRIGDDEELRQHQQS
uniref:(California timema) hypothetical protein n=1 Tax=Timema californicum TaxID=61474 RepID=A0A7R9J3A2_TIMCA|nr:unnamed protein product [Timema californicum]